MSLGNRVQVEADRPSASPRGVRCQLTQQRMHCGDCKYTRACARAAGACCCTAARGHALTARHAVLSACTHRGVCAAAETRQAASRRGTRYPLMLRLLKLTNPARGPTKGTGVDK